MHIGNIHHGHASYNITSVYIYTVSSSAISNHIPSTDVALNSIPQDCTEVHDDNLVLLTLHE